MEWNPEVHVEEALPRRAEAVASVTLQQCQAPKNRPSDRPGRCLKVRGRIHTVPVTSDRTSDFSGYPSQNLQTESYMVLSLAL